MYVHYGYRAWLMTRKVESLCYRLLFFFFQAEDGIRDDLVTGVQTCALPISELADRIAALPLLFEPGTAWNYSYSTDVLARVVEVASGRPLDELFRERIFEQIGRASCRERV